MTDGYGIRLCGFEWVPCDGNCKWCHRRWVHNFTSTGLSYEEFEEMQNRIREREINDLLRETLAKVEALERPKKRVKVRRVGRKPRKNLR